jgi:hypothetical protein
MNVPGGFQVIVRGQRGDNLASAFPDVASLRNYQAADQTDPNSDSGSDFTCAVPWASPSLPHERTYTVQYGKQSWVVNVANAGEDIDFAPIAP